MQNHQKNIFSLCILSMDFRRKICYNIITAREHRKKGKQKMKRVLEYDKEYRTNNVKNAINRFFNTHSDVDYWKEQFFYMYENGQSFCCDNLMANGDKNDDWCYALHLDVDEKFVYMAVIERA